MDYTYDDTEPLDVYSWSDKALVAVSANQMTPAQIALRKAFVEQYLLDYNPYNAALRINLAGTAAVEYSRTLMAEPYVQQLIVKMSLLKPNVPDEDELLKKKRMIIEGLMKEANYQGTGSSASARVAAWTQLAKLLGVDKDPDDEASIIKGGVMAVSREMTIEDWEAEAMASQKKLAQESLADV